MGILSGIFKVRDKPENRTAGSAYTFYMGGSTSGKNVTERSVMQMTVAFFSISFSVLRRWVSFWRALYSLRVTVSSSDTLIGERCLYSSDTPYGEPYLYRQLIEFVGSDKRTVEMALGENISRLLALDER